MIPRSINFSLVVVTCPILLLFLLLLPLYSYAIEQFYTVQTGSFIVPDNAQKQFDSLKRKLDENELDYIRIEKVNKYYIVRLGKFENKSAAKNIFQVVKSQFPSAIILKVSIADENIARLYQNSSLSAEDNKIEKTPMSTATSEEVKPEKIEVNPSNPVANDVESYIKKLLTEGRYSEAIEAYKKAIDESQDKKEKALLHKELGDLFVSKDDYKNAAEEFIKALSLYRFSEEERLKMAIYISWGDRLDESIAEIKAILSENPKNVEARIHLARVLSWYGGLDEAIGEAEKVLKESPENKDALLVKANSLNWKGDYKTAMPIYKKLLEKGEDFDARLGLTYALLSSGNKKGAQECSRFLQPKYAYQERELKKLNEAMDREKMPNFDIRYSYYKDSDDNRLNRYSLGYGFLLDNWKLDLNYRHTDAQDDTRDKRAEDLSFKVYSKVTESIGIGGGLGLSQVGNGESTNFLTGHIKADINILNGSAGFSLAREAVTDTAQLIENKIRVTNASLYISQKLTDRLSLNGNYSYRDYSDNNNANDFQFSPSYAIYKRNPTINLGYRFRYLNFNRQSGSGYFDPNDFISHQVFVSLYLEREKFYCYFEPHAGHQSFKRNGDRTHDYFGGAYGTFGYKITKKASFEVNAEGGNYALGTAAGFRYYLFGLRLLVFL